MKRIMMFSLFVMGISLTAFAQEYRVNRTYENKRTKLKSAGLGKNIIAFSPVSIAMNSVMNDGEPNVAVGMSYERIFDNEYISFRLPVNFTIEKPGIYLMPTIKLYPKKQGIVKYAIGPQFLISYVEDYFHPYLYGPAPLPVSKLETRRQFGFALNNSLNFTISKNLYVGMDASLGILYYDSFNEKTNNNYNYNNSGSPLDLNLNQSFSLGVSFGCRF